MMQGCLIKPLLLSRESDSDVFLPLRGWGVKTKLYYKWILKFIIPKTQKKFKKKT